MPYKNREDRIKNSKKRYRKRLSTGICVCCNQKSINGTTMCEKHLLIYREKSNNKNKIDRKFAIENRLCERCRTPLEDNEKRCCINCCGKKTRKEMTYAAHTLRITT